ncbi:uncharacterized protein TNCV_2018831 [Trichonephila clavipes]|nr:uncharacterized protein TNCV_2018831 [Trichonephila clavipes]
MARIGQQKRCYVPSGQRQETHFCSDSPEPLGSWLVVDCSLVYCYRCTNDGFVNRRLLHSGLRARCLYTGSPSLQTIDGCVCNGLMSTEPGKLISTKLSFQMNYASICWTMMAAFVLDVMPVNAVFQSALSNDRVA